MSADLSGYFINASTQKIFPYNAQKIFQCLQICTNARRKLVPRGGPGFSRSGLIRSRISLKITKNGNLKINHLIMS